MKTQHAIWSALAALALYGCGIADPSRDLANYFRKFLDTGKITVTEESRGMFSSSRMGYFIFTLPREESAKLQAALSLKPITSWDEERRVCLLYRDRFKEVKNIKFDIWNTGWNPDAEGTWLDDKGHDVKPTKPSITIFIANPPLPPLAGNSTTSFKHLFYDSSTGRCYVILEYPYG
jgi:hypothetical protein